MVLDTIKTWTYFNCFLKQVLNTFLLIFVHYYICFSFIRFLEEYEKHNLSFWGLTTGNEPTAGEMTNYSFQALGFTPKLQRDWIATDLGPALRSSPYAKTRLMILDDNRLLLPYWAKVVSEESKRAEIITATRQFKHVRSNT